MSDVYLVGFDASEGAEHALDFAMERARPTNAQIKLVHVLEWSPYSFLTQEELAERHARRTEELSRAEADIAPVVDRVKAAGLDCEAVIRYGHVAETVCSLVDELGAKQIFVGRTGGSSGLTSRIFGSVQLALVQAAPVAVTVVP